MRGKKMSQAMAFIVLFGIVSLFSDMTHEGASSIRGAYLALLGASAGTIGFISGLGELVGYSMRYVFGKLTDKSKHYWPMTIAGYVLDVLAVPALALVGDHGWIWACALLVIQRMGKAIKKPAKDTIMSFAASQEGGGQELRHPGGAGPDRRVPGAGAAVCGDAAENRRHHLPGVCHVLCGAGHPRGHHADPAAGDPAEIPQPGALRAGAQGVRPLPHEEGVHPVHRRHQPVCLRLHRLFHHHHACLPDLHRCGGGPAGNGKSDLQRNAAPAVCRGHAGGRGGGPVLRAAV